MKRFLKHTKRFTFSPLLIRTTFTLVEVSYVHTCTAAAHCQSAATAPLTVAAANLDSMNR